MNTTRQRSQNYIHWCKDQQKREIGLEKRKRTIQSKYSIEDIRNLKRCGAITGYQRTAQDLNDTEVYDIELFKSTMRDLDVGSFTGKSGNRKLIKYDKRLYKSLIKYTEFLSEFTTKVYFVLRLKVAKNELELSSSMKCRCGRKTSFDPQTQDFTKKFCRHCFLAFRSREWFKYTYGDVEGLARYDEYMRQPDVVEKRKYSGGKSFESRVGRLFNGCLAKGKNEEVILNFIEAINNIKIERGYPVRGYYLDGYCVETNTAYEVYEQYHNSKEQKEYDIARQNSIMNELKCKFVIIHDDTRNVLNLDKLIIETHNV